MVATLAGKTPAPPTRSPGTRARRARGRMALTAVGRDPLGLQYTSNAVTVMVSNGPPPDASPPTVTLTSPTSGSTVSGPIEVRATASDDVGVAGVQFKLDDADLGGEDTTAPYAVSWDPSTASEGPHTLTAVARNDAGNMTTSEPVTVTVSHAPPPPPPATFAPGDVSRSRQGQCSGGAPTARSTPSLSARCRAPPKASGSTLPATCTSPTGARTRPAPPAIPSRSSTPTECRRGRSAAGTTVIRTRSPSTPRAASTSAKPTAPAPS